MCVCVCGGGVGVVGQADLSHVTSSLLTRLICLPCLIIVTHTHTQRSGMQLNLATLTPLPLLHPSPQAWLPVVCMALQRIKAGSVCVSVCGLYSSHIFPTSIIATTIHVSLYFLGVKLPVASGLQD